MASLALGGGSSGLSTLGGGSLTSLALGAGGRSLTSLALGGRSLASLTLGSGSLGSLATLHSALGLATLDHFGGAGNGLILAGTAVLEEEVRSLGAGSEGSHQNSVEHE